MGDVIGITDNQGNELVQYEYDEWGVTSKITSVHNTSAERSLGYLNPLRYRGYYFDSEFGLYYLQSRYYSPGIGRFINTDAPEYVQMQRDDYAGINSYLYCCNDPVNNVDPSGCWKKKHHYNWTLSWIQTWVSSEKAFNNLKKYCVDIANYCKKLDEEYPSTYYATHLNNKASKKWQYFHFNGNLTGKDTRIEYSDNMLKNAISNWKYNRQKSLMYLGYGLHAIQDIEAHGQIGRGKSIPAHGNTADNEDYVWNDGEKKKLRKKRKGDQSRKTKTYYSSFSYLKRFCNAIRG